MDKKELREELKKQYKTRDRVVRVISNDGLFRAVAIKNTDTAKEAQKRHQLDYVPAYLLARTLASASLMSAFLKGEERIQLEFSGNGPISFVYGEAMQLGEVRGYVRFSKNSTKKKMETIGDALGEGTLKVSRILFNKSEPVTGIVPIAVGDIATDIANYYAQSEQIATAVILDVEFDDKGVIWQSGGLIVQAMPGSTKDQVEVVYNKLRELKSLATYFDNDLTPEDCLKDILPFEYEMVKSSQVDFFCRCSKEKFMEKLLTFGKEEILELKNNENRELVCMYCNNKYQLTDEDFGKMLEESQAKEN